MSVARYRTTRSITVVFQEHHRDVAGLVPEGAIFEISTDVCDGEELVAGHWNGKPIMVFQRDLRSSGVLVEEQPGPSMDEGKILQILRSDLKAASKTAAEASAKFDRAVSAPTGLPQPDGTQHILRASREVSAARSKLMDCLKRLNTFLISGKIPQDLDSSDKGDSHTHSSGK